MSTTQAMHSEAASSLVQLLPTQFPLEAVPASGAVIPAEAVQEAVTASYVGSASVDVALVLPASEPVSTLAGTDSALVSTADVLRPAIEAAVGTLGPGVLGDTRVEDAAALFAHPSTSVYELRAAAGGTAGWFAIRSREDSAVPAAAPAETSVVGKLGRISNVEMALTVEIGRTRMAVRDVLNLEPGRVIELDRSAGAPADILLNGRLIANGEIVVLDQDYAVRITKILDVAEGLA